MLNLAKYTQKRTIIKRKNLPSTVNQKSKRTFHRFAHTLLHSCSHTFSLFLSCSCTLSLSPLIFSLYLTLCIALSFSLPLAYLSLTFSLSLLFLHSLTSHFLTLTQLSFTQLSHINSLFSLICLHYAFVAFKSINLNQYLASMHEINTQSLAHTPAYTHRIWNKSKQPIIHNMTFQLNERPVISHVVGRSPLAFHWTTVRHTTHQTMGTKPFSKQMMW